VSSFKNVEVTKEANVYFEGKVVSYSIGFEDGVIKTLGVMQIGEYEFSTADAEIMDILNGELDVTLPGANEAVTIKGGESFEIPANSKFSVNVKSVTDYCCHYIK